MQVTRRRFLAVVPPLAAAALLRRPLSAQEPQASDKGIRLDKQLTQRWKVGMVIEAQGPCVGIFATAPVPTDWPEQRVTVVGEEKSAEVTRIGYRTLDNGVKQLLVLVPQLAAGRTASTSVTLEVTKASILPPSDPSLLQIPKSPPRDVRKYLGASPYIETRNREIRSQALKLFSESEGASDWQKIEVLYDWVRENVKYEDGELKGALAAMRDGTGDCEELTSLFIAFCRVNKIPARTVWVPGHCYPEFYLEDDEGNGHWIPCQAAGTRDFCGMPDHRPILQKGDNFTVPEVSKPQRYVAEFLQTQSVRGLPPQVKFIRELSAAD
jgi:hypothetical protein